MENSFPFEQQTSRRNLLAALGSVAIFGFLTKKFIGNGRESRVAMLKKSAIDCGPGPGKGVRMLTQDGRLVELDPSFGKAVKKASNEETRDWIKSKKY